MLEQFAVRYEDSCGRMRIGPMLPHKAATNHQGGQRLILLRLPYWTVDMNRYRVRVLEQASESWLVVLRSHHVGKIICRKMTARQGRDLEELVTICKGYCTRTHWIQ